MILAARLWIWNVILCLSVFNRINAYSWVNEGTTRVPQSENDYHSDPLVVRTKKGLIRGYAKNVFGREVHIFTGIPFAKPPVGELRFRRPITVEPWPEILNATQLPNSCIQERYEYFPGFKGEEMWNPNTNVSEDCLYLNIWVPQKVRLRHHADRNHQQTVHNTPVLIWIYGGGFMTGTSTLDIYDGSILATTCDAIVISIQYRIGAFGFLYIKDDVLRLDDEELGNLGLWDQALAIQWVKDNIRFFGGDPNVVTLFGESAGASSISLLLISPITKGMVRRAILQSGTINAEWSYMTAERAHQIGKVLIDDCGCNSSLLAMKPRQVMQCMRTVDAKTISLQQWNSYSGILGFPSAPLIDGIFMPKLPIELIAEGDFEDIEIMIGVNKDEGSYFLLYDFIDFFEKDGPSFLQREKYYDIMNTIFRNTSQIQRDAIVFQYTDWEHANDGYLNQKMISNAVGDYYFVCPTNVFAEIAASRGMKIYYYFFTHRTSTSLWGEWMGVLHGDEVEYVFGHPLNMSLQFNSRERELSLKVMQSFVRFAATGKPVTDDVNWPLYTKERPQYFIFNANKSGIGKGPHAATCAFWNTWFLKLKNYFESSVHPCVNTYLHKFGSTSVALSKISHYQLVYISIVLHFFY